MTPLPALRNNISIGLFPCVARKFKQKSLTDDSEDVSIIPISTVVSDDFICSIAFAALEHLFSFRQTIIMLTSHFDSCFAIEKPDQSV